MYFNKFLLEIEEQRKLKVEQRNEMVRRLESLPPKYVIHTVHGTFARKAEWFKQPGSYFCRNLIEGLGWRARIEPFIWSGKNRFGARWKAAQELKDHLKDKLKVFPDARHVVIAHSHGGNVVFMAINSSDLSKQVLGVVTLATPFLSARVRSYEEFIDPYTGFVTGLFAGWAVLFFGYFRGLCWSLWPWAIAACALMTGITFLGAWLTRRMHGCAKRICSLISKTALSSEQVAVVRMQGDEAIAAIAGTRLAGRLADLIWSILSARIFKFLNQLLNIWDYRGIRSIWESFLEKHGFGETYRFFVPRKRLDQLSKPLDIKVSLTKDIASFIFQFFAVWASMGFVGFNSFFNSFDVQFWMIFFMGIYSLPAAFSVATVAIGVPFSVLSSISLFLCGPIAPFAGHYLHLTAEPSPPGSWTVTHFENTDNNNRLFHSEAHENSSVLVFLTKWIEMRANTKEAGQQSGQQSQWPGSHLD